MAVLILEREGYSSEALKLYSSYDKVYFWDDAVDKYKITVLVIRLSFYIDAAYCAKFPNLKFIITPTTGLNHIDSAGIKKLGISILSLNNVKNQITTISSTSEIAIWHIINAVRKASIASSDVTSGNWDRDRYRSRQLSSLSLGIVGLGRIGLQVAKTLTTIGMKTFYFDPYVKEAPLWIAKCDTLDDVMKSCDVVSLHCNFTPDTNKLINKSKLETFKTGAILVNTARGELVDEEAILQNILSEKLSIYAADVLTDETQFYDNILFKAALTNPRIQLTPHIGGCSIDAMHSTEVAMAKYFLGVIT